MARATPSRSAPGLPSTVGEDLLKNADFNIYVRDRSPSVRLAGKAYVLPRTGQQGIPLITVNTDTVKATIYRIGDRSLIDNVLGYDFERNLYSYTLDEIADQKGEKVWTGELKVEKQLNQEITTAFPIMEAVPQLEPGVYLLAARPGNVPGDDYGERTTQWFIVSDLGLTAFSGTDGIHAYVNSLATHGAACRCRDPAACPQQRGARGQEDRRQRRRHLRAGTCARRRRAVARADRGVGRRRRLRLPQSEAIGVRSDRPGRGRTRRAARARCVRVHRARRLSHRRDGLCDGAAARRRRRGRPGRRPDHGGGAPRRGRVSPHRRAGPGDRRTLARRADHRVGADRDMARRRLCRPERRGDRERELPGRGLRAGSARIRSHHQGHRDLARRPVEVAARRPLPLWRAGGGARHRRRSQYRQGRRAAGLSRLFVRPRSLPRATTRKTRPAPRAFLSPICPRPMPTARRRSRSLSTRCPPRPGRSKPMSWCVSPSLAEGRSSASSRFPSCRARR